MNLYRVKALYANMSDEDDAWEFETAVDALDFAYALLKSRHYCRVRVVYDDHVFFELRNFATDPGHEPPKET